MFERGPEKPKYPYSETAKKIFARFEARSDEPGEFLSGKEKEKLQEETRINPEALKKWEEDRHSKYRINSLYAPILAAENFLGSLEVEGMPEDVKKSLNERVQKCYGDLENARGKRIQKELVDEVVDIVKEVKKYLKQ